jgi:hypothetical protein
MMRRLLAPLLALAVALAAAACRRDPQPDRDPQRCATCHLEEFQQAKRPVHAGVRPTTCAVCHSQDAWRPSILDHPFFPLTEAHAKPTCFACHKGRPPKLHGTPKECIGCHRPEYERAPGHVAQKFPTKCERCHQTTVWGDHRPAEPPKRPQPAKPPPTATGQPAPQPPLPPQETARPSPRPPDATAQPSPRE